MKFKKVPRKSACTVSVYIHNRILHTKNVNFKKQNKTKKPDNGLNLVLLLIRPSVEQSKTKP